MRVGYKIENTIVINPQYILISNYKPRNEIGNYGYKNLSSMLAGKTRHDIGYWKIKIKK